VYGSRQTVVLPHQVTTRPIGMVKIKAFAYNNPVRVSAWVTSTVALVLSVISSDIPTEAVTMFILSTLGLGEFAQRAENKKTDEALFSEIPK
jgi:hypothetical protein